EWLNRVGRDERPLFLWVHLYDPHDPYDPPPPFREAFAGRPYDGEIAFADQAVGAIFDQYARLGRRVPPIVAVVGDHGESLGEHEEETHAMFVYESTLRVPLILSWPGHLPAGRRVPAVVRGIDLAPTLLDLAGQPPLAARGETPAAFGRRCIPADCVAPPSHIRDIFGRRALSAGRLAALGATPDFHHGLPAGMQGQSLRPRCDAGLSPRAASRDAGAESRPAHPGPA
ncbi:MAG: hypothetical protein DMF97_18135, partial [Acidobacteria bacterium]